MALACDSGEKYSVTKMTSSHCGGELFTAMKNPVGRTVRQDSTSICIKDLKYQASAIPWPWPILARVLRGSFLGVGLGDGCVCIF